MALGGMAIGAVVHQLARNWGWIVFRGVAAIMFGVLALPGMTALVLLSFIAAWALITGVFQVAAAIRLRKVISNEWMLALSGVLSIAFGVLMLARPAAGAPAVIWIIGWYATLFGVMLVMLGLRIRGLAGSVPKPA